MPRKSSKVSEKPLAFASEREEADWLTSPAGRRYIGQRLQKSFGAGVIVTESRKIDPELRAEANRTGKAIYYKNGLDIKPTDPAVLQELMDSVKAKKTQAVSLRIPVSEIEAAKKLAAKLGLGYQTLLKEIISKALQNA
jgi:hypothetical protein